MADRFDDVPPSPFRRLASLIGDIEPGKDPISMAVGEPGHAFPGFIMDVITQHQADFSKYPPANGTPMMREAVASWLNKRYSLDGSLDPDRHIQPLSGTREGLFSILLVVVPLSTSEIKPKVIIPNPFYHTYAAAAVAAGAEPYFVTADKSTGFLPDLDALSDEVLDSTACYYLCSPANPQGVVADIEYLKKAILLARKHEFTLLIDECYSEIYDKIKPCGGLEAAQELGAGFDNILVFNSLSKRSNLAGLRVGFCAGDEGLIERFLKYRNLGAPQTPLPHMAAATVAWSDEAHVEASRKLYQTKFDMAEDILGGNLGFYRPPGGFFLWLDVSSMGGSEAATCRLWREVGIRTVPGAYLARPDQHGFNPAENYLRLALVNSPGVTEEALKRISTLL